MRILTIGNSFTDSLAVCFPAAAASAGAELHLEFANFGGCEMARHWSYIQAEEHGGADCRIYGGAKLRDRLAQGDWDMVSIQQASHDSWRPETFEPYAGFLIAYIRKYAPRAEVVIQQTWAYRADHPMLQPGSEWGITQEEMYRRLTENYLALGERHKLRVIPTGCAVTLSRTETDAPFVPYPAELVGRLRWPDLPPQAGDVVGRCFWHKGADGELALHRDLIHLNIRGQYLQSCVWLGFCFGIDPETVRYVPEEIGNSDAAFLRRIAGKAPATFAAHGAAVRSPKG